MDFWRNPPTWIIFLVICLFENTKQSHLPSRINASKHADDSEKQKSRTEDDYFWETSQLDTAVRYGFESLEQLLTVKEPIWYKMGLYLDANHPASKVANFGKPNKRALELSNFGYATLEASMKLAKSFPENSSRQFTDFPNAIKSRMIEESCPLRGKPRCPLASKRYRTADGTCNNLKEPWKGSSMLPFERFLPPVYEDGIQSIRRSVRGGHLPSPRLISVKIHREKNKETQGITLMFMQWGQFIDHDITNAAKSRSFNGTIPRCCDGGGRGLLPEELLHPACLPIEIPGDDWFFGRFGLRCMEFLRSAPSTRIDCDLGWREQINQVTSFIDASTIYGSDVETSDSIRTFRNGKVIYGRPGEPRRPPDPPHGEICRSGALTIDCLQPGDGRVSEQPGLTALHTVWIRYHNKVATVLARHNPHWSDEKVFQETRRIVYGLVQHITYREFLPVLLGPEVVELFELDLVTKGFYKGYNGKVDPAIANAFSSAAYRFGHSMVQNSYVRTDIKHRPILNNVTIHEEPTNFENIWSLGSLDRFLLGVCNQPAQKRDEYVCDELTNHLFQPPTLPFGADLTATNLQRGRDHGLPPYTSWREPCGLTTVRTWSDLEKVFTAGAVERFRRVYRHVDDVDLFSGGLAEKPVRGGVVGPTFACIIAQQFLNLRKGDRFWYENGGFPSAFTPAQLQQIRRVSFSSILCQTLGEIETVQKFVFLSADGFENSRISCDSASMRHLDLLPWIENDTNPKPKRVRRLVKHKNRNKTSSTTTTAKPEAPKPKTKYQKVAPNVPVEVNIKIQYFLPSSTSKPVAPPKKKKRPTGATNNTPFWVSNAAATYPAQENTHYGGVSSSKPAYIYNRPSYYDFSPSGIEDYSYSPSRPTSQDVYTSQSYRPAQFLSRPISVDRYGSETSNRPNKIHPRPGSYNGGYNQDVEDYDELTLDSPTLIISPQRPSNQYYTYQPQYYDEIPSYTQLRPAGAYDRIDVDSVDIPKRPSFSHAEPVGNKFGGSVGHVQKIKNDHVNDKLDFKTRQPIRDDEGFVKISSVKAQALFPSRHSPVISTVLQREGDAEIDDGKGGGSEKLVGLVEIDVAPDEINENNWLVYNETEDSAPQIPLPEFNQGESCTEEFPQQMKIVKK